MTELVLIANSGSGSISVLRLHREPERLELLHTTDGLEGCGTFAVDTERDLVHAAAKGEQPVVVTLRLDRESGELTELSRREVADSMTYLSLAEGGTLLLGASYGGGMGQVWPVTGLDGDSPQVGEAVEQDTTVEFGNLHCVVTGDSGAGTVAYFVSLGDDLVAQYALDRSGRLTPLDPPTVAAPQGSGPRHLVVDGDHAYLMTEFSGEAIHLHRRGDGALVIADSVETTDPRHGLKHSRLGADPVEEHLIWGADLHRAGDWLITSERSSSELASIPVDGEGRLGEVAHHAETQPQPRGFNVTADGAYLVAVGERSTRAELRRVEADGSLTALCTAEIGEGPNWVRIV